MNIKQYLFHIYRVFVKEIMIPMNIVTFYNYVIDIFI